MLSKKRTIHVVSHTHWDREWYFSTHDSLVLLDQVVTDVILELERNEKVNFTLDGQISIVLEYLNIRPEMKERFLKLVNEKRLFIGPWYTQTDTQLIGEASIVNNLYYGIYDSLQLSKHYLNIGYLPDTFGFSPQMPMLYKQFGINQAIVWRGVDFQGQKIEPYFNWIGQDGGQVSTFDLYRGYGMAKGFNASESFVSNTLQSILRDYQELSSNPHVLLPVGNDQNNIIPDLNEVVKEINGEDDLVISDYESFAKSAQEYITTSYQGELRQVNYSRVHKTSGGIRIDLKQSNYDGEIALSKIIEPLQAMAHIEGLEVSTKLIEKAWKLLFEGAAHDGAIGCVSDSVAEDIMNRNKQSLEISKSIENLIKRKFAEAVDLQDNEILLFNLSPKSFIGARVIEVFSHSPAVMIEGHDTRWLRTKKIKGHPKALVETPNGNFYEKEEDYYLHTLEVEVSQQGFGYTIIKWKACNTFAYQTGYDSEIHNHKFIIKYERGSINLIWDKQILNDFVVIEDVGNSGDTYDFSPLESDKRIMATFSNPQTVKQKHHEVMILDVGLEIPQTLQDRSEGIINHTLTGKIKITLADDSLPQVDLEVDNTAYNHRLRIGFKGLKTVQASKAAVPWGSVVRSVLRKPLPNDWSKYYDEYPIDIETNSGFVRQQAENEQLVLFNKGIKEYQIIDDYTYMTLFSSTDSFGKEDLLYRPGRASGDTTKKGHVPIPTPQAQVLGKHGFAFGFDFLSDDDETLYTILDRFEQPTVFYQKQSFNLFYERIDNKIQLHETALNLPKEKYYVILNSEQRITNIYNSLYTGELVMRFMSFKNESASNLDFDHSNLIIGNLLEKGNYTYLNGYRLYTVKGFKHGN